MQRKNNILTPLKSTVKDFSSRNNFKTNHKSGFAMIMAITVIVVIATIMALSLSMTAETSKRTTDIYLYEQSVLYSKSATEYALLQIAENNPCNWTGDNFTIDEDGAGSGIGIYDVNISVQYIYTDASTACAPGLDYFDIVTEEQNGSVLMDVTVSVDPSQTLGEPIRYFRRTIQKL